MTTIDPLDRSDSSKFEMSKIQYGGDRHLAKSKITISPEWFERSSINLAW